MPPVLETPDCLPSIRPTSSAAVRRFGPSLLSSSGGRRQWPCGVRLYPRGLRPRHGLLTRFFRRLPAMLWSGDFRRNSCRAGVCGRPASGRCGFGFCMGLACFLPCLAGAGLLRRLYTRRWRYSPSGLWRLSRLPYCAGSLRSCRARVGGRLCHCHSLFGLRVGTVRRPCLRGCSLGNLLGWSSRSGRRHSRTAFLTCHLCGTCGAGGLGCIRLRLTSVGAHSRRHGSCHIGTGGPRGSRSRAGLRPSCTIEGPIGGSRRGAAAALPAAVGCSPAGAATLAASGSAIDKAVSSCAIASAVSWRSAMKASRPTSSNAAARYTHIKAAACGLSGPGACPGSCRAGAGDIRASHITGSPACTRRYGTVPAGSGRRTAALMDLRIGCGGRCARAGSVGSAGWRCAPWGRCVLIGTRLLVLLCGGLLGAALPVMYLLAVGLLGGIPPAAGPENGAQTAQAGCRRANCALPPRQKRRALRL